MKQLTANVMILIMTVSAHASTLSVVSPVIMSINGTTSVLRTTLTYSVYLYDSTNVRNTSLEGCITPTLTINNTPISNWGESVSMATSELISTITYSGVLVNNCEYNLTGSIVLVSSSRSIYISSFGITSGSICTLDIPSIISFSTIPADEIGTNSHEVSMQSSGQCDKTFSLTFTGASDGEYFKLGDYLGAKLTYVGTVVKPGVAFSPPVEQSYIWTLYPLKASVPAGTYTSPVVVTLDVN